MSTLFQDVRYGLRMLAKNPGFTAVAVLTLALGIGANTAIFSMVNALLFRPLPVSHPEQIYTLSATGPSGGNSFSVPDYEEIRNQTNSLFSDMAGVGGLFSTTGLRVAGKSERMSTQFVTGNFFSMLGVRPALGRFILPTEGRAAGSDPVVVLSFDFWKSRFGGDPDIIGQKALVNGHAATIIGVAPAEFHPLSSFLDTQGYIPLGMMVVDHRTPPEFLGDREGKQLILMARLRPGVTEAKIRSVLDVVAQRMAAEYPKADAWTGLIAFPLPPTGPTSSPHSPLLAISALFLALASVVLILACVNVANILLVRGSARRGEIAIRAALGARRGRLIWQLLIESLLLALLGGMGGTMVGSAASGALNSIPLHMDLPLVLDFHFDWRVFAYAFGVAALGGAIAGVVPAWRSTGGDLNDLLHSVGRGATPGGHRFRKLLVVAQIAGSLVLLIVAGLFTRSLMSAQRSDLGFDPQHVLNVALDPALAGYTQTDAFNAAERVHARIQSLPGVRSASLAVSVPMGGFNMGYALDIEGYTPPAGERTASAGCNVVSPGYFQTMGIPVVRGREIQANDDQDPAHIAVVNQAMAERFWPGTDPIGKQFRVEDDLNHPVLVVGVVRNSQTTELLGSLPVSPYFYLALSRKRMRPVTLQVRTAGDPALMIPAILGAIHTQEPDIPLGNVQTMTEALDTLNGLLLFKLGAALTGCLGILGLILAVIGMYGVISYATVQRTHEIGIRLALGANPHEILRAVMQQGISIIAVGTLAGILLTFAAARVVGHFLVGVSPTDPFTYVGIALLLASVGLAASYIPARRATKVDPMVALRHE